MRRETKNGAAGEIWTGIYWGGNYAAGGARGDARRVLRSVSGSTFATWAAQPTTTGAEMLVATIVRRAGAWATWQTWHAAALSEFSWWCH